MKHQDSITVTEISKVLRDSSILPKSFADLCTPTLDLSAPSNLHDLRIPSCLLALSVFQTLIFGPARTIAPSHR